MLASCMVQGPVVVFGHTAQPVGFEFPNLCPLQWKFSLNHWTSRELPFLLLLSTESSPHFSAGLSVVGPGSSANLLVLPLLTVLNVPLHKLYSLPRVSLLSSWALDHCLHSFHLPLGMPLELGTVCAQPSTALCSSFLP